MSIIRSIEIAAELVNDFGFYPLPLHPRSKKPVSDGWSDSPKEKVDPLSRFTRPDYNVGVITGKPSGGLADVDLDCDEAVQIGKIWLPPTANFGRPSRPQSHWLYRIDLEVYVPFVNPRTRKKLIELRAHGGHQTVFPGSVHQETGEPIEWHDRCKPLELAGKDLIARCEVLAAASLIKMYYPAKGEGARHDACLVLGGFLARCKTWGEDDILRFVAAIADDPLEDDLADRLKAAVGGVRGLDRDRNVYGLPALLALLGEDVGRRVAEWLHYPALERNTKAKRGMEEFRPTRIERTNLATVEPENINWLWRYRFARGKYSIIGGNPGELKSQFALYMAARCSLGGAYWVEGRPEEGIAPLCRTYYLTSEDATRDTILPRLLAAGGNRKMVEVIKSVVDDDGRRDAFNLVRDLEVAEQDIVSLGDVGLLVLDPFDAYLGIGKVDNYRSADLRGVLLPLQEMAERLGICVIAIMHNRKDSSGHALARFMGSFANVAAARLVWGVIRESTILDEDDPPSDRRLMPSGKSNVGPERIGCGFRFKPAGYSDLKPATIPE